MKTEKYRYDSAYETLYAWSEEHEAHLFAANANGRTMEETIRDYEEHEVLKSEQQRERWLRAQGL